MLEKRFDVVGSFLRPENLKKARSDFEKGRISADDFDAVKKDEIKKLVEKQKKAGLPYITDGEFNRKFWHLDFFWGFGGIGHKKDGGGVQFSGEVADLEDTFLTGKIYAGAHPFVEDFKFLKSLESPGFEAKQTVPSPGAASAAAQCPQEFRRDKKNISFKRGAYRRHRRRLPRCNQTALRCRMPHSPA